MINVTYILDHRLLKEEQYRVRITVGGDRFTYLEDYGPSAANLLETKVLINSTISNPRHGARFMSADIKDYFLTTRMAKAEFMKVQYKHIPDDIQIKYNLITKITTYNLFTS